MEQRGNEEFERKFLQLNSNFWNLLIILPMNLNQAINEPHKNWKNLNIKITANQRKYLIIPQANSIGCPYAKNKFEIEKYTKQNNVIRIYKLMSQHYKFQHQTGTNMGAGTPNHLHWLCWYHIYYTNWYWGFFILFGAVNLGMYHWYQYCTNISWKMLQGFINVDMS